MRFKTIVLVFFVAYLVAGLAIYDHYGFCWDDGADRSYGLLNWRYAFEGNNELLTHFDRYHGPAIEMLLVGVEKALGYTDTHDIYLVHHLCDFLIFYLAVILFFFSARLLFKSDKWALLTCLMLVLSPRMFADSFFNSKDIGFLSTMIFAFGSLLLLNSRPSFFAVFLHALACGFAIDVRLLAIIIVPFTLMVLVKHIVASPANRGRYIALSLAYLVLLPAFTVLFWPVLWKRPLYEFGQAWVQMKSFPWKGTVLYFGSYIWSDRLPWHYLPVWILITTPLLFSLAWLGGTLLIIKQFITAPFVFIKEKTEWLAVPALCIAPVLAVIIFKSVVYDGWRHVFFIYPFFILTGVYALKALYHKVAPKFANAFKAATATYLAFLLGIIIYLHPHENVYFNMPVLAGLHPVSEKFEMDYWGLSDVYGQLYLLKTIPEGKIKVWAYEGPAKWSLEILKPEDRARLEWTATAEEADFFITEHRWRTTMAGPANKTPVYQIRKFDNPVMTVYRVNK